MEWYLKVCFRPSTGQEVIAHNCFVSCQVHMDLSVRVERQSVVWDKDDEEMRIDTVRLECCAGLCFIWLIFERWGA